MLNPHLLEIEEENVFSKVTEKVALYKKQFPQKELISLGIGDVSKPVIPPIIEAMHKAVDDLADMEHFMGYGNYYGCDFLRQAIWENEYRQYGLSADEIYVGDGTKTDTTSLLELFDEKAKVLVGNPMYPIYINGARALSRTVYTIGLDENFKLLIPKEHYDIIYICSPNNPVGNAYTYSDLEKWISYALKEQAIIIFDNVYHAFVHSKDIPQSIYELKGAKQCCIECRSFSKNASFTGVRCSYYVLPKEMGYTKYWLERTLNRFNGASYIAQRGAQAAYLPQSQALIQQNIAAYLENAAYLRKGFDDAGFEVVGGIDAPFMWVRCKTPTSWETFDFFLNELNIIVIPGIIFGSGGDGFFRISALGLKENSEIAIERIRQYYEK